MKLYRTGRALGIFVLAFAAGSSLTLAQKGGIGAGSAGSSPSGGGATRSPLPTTTPTIPSTGPTSPSTGSMSNPVFLEGRVAFDDGSTPNTNIRIERVCAGTPRLEGHTDNKGRFYIQLGQNNAVDVDAADDTSGIRRPGQTPGADSTTMSGRNFASSNANLYWNCDLRAAYPGYRSDEVSLSQRRSLDDPQVGTIILHRLANVKGSTISLTTQLAPKKAQKQYEKGLQLASKGKFEDAEKQFADATKEYPRYAVAWFALGEIQQRAGKPGDARSSYHAAIAADARYVSPYDQLALLAAQDGKWEDAAGFSKQVIELNPVEFPSSYWYNAIANFNLRKLSQADASARELLKLDTQHRYPEAEDLVAEISLQKGDVAGAVMHMKAYLTLAPTGKNAGAVRNALAKLQPPQTPPPNVERSEPPR